MLIVCSKHGVSFYNPQLQEGWNECFIPHELAMKEACRLLFFVITDDTRAVTSMLEVCSPLLDTLKAGTLCCITYRLQFYRIILLSYNTIVGWELEGYPGCKKTVKTVVTCKIKHLQNVCKTF